MFLRLCLCLVCISLLVSCQERKKAPSTQRLRVNIYTEPPTLDSRKATDATSMNVLLALFEGLTRIGSDERPHPALAEKIDISEDQKTYTFTLREAYWSNGDPVTAEDFAYTWRKILDPEFPALFAYKLYIIQNAYEVRARQLPIEALGIQALDERTLQVKLKNPTPYFLELTAFPTFFPVHQKTAQKNPEWAAEAGPEFVHNGPFTMKKWKHESEIQLIKNPLYWDLEQVKLDELHLAIVDDLTTEFYMYERDELDWAGSPLSALPSEFLPALIEEGRVEILPANAVYYFKINTEHYPLHNPSIRKALGLAINRQEIVEHVLQGKQLPAQALIPSMPGWKTPATLFPDGEKNLAKALFAKGLEEEGLSLTTFPPLAISYNTNREHQKIAQAIQQQWKEVLGIKVELDTCDWKVYLSKISQQDYQIGRMSWIGDFCDPVSFLEPYKLKDGGLNETGWENPHYISLLTQAEKELDIEKRKKLLKEAETLLVDEMPIIPVYYINHCFLRKPYVKRVYLSSLGVIDFKEAYVEK
ncbi:MAG: Oligopeptide-binding protein OppA [Chlamydiae bacterium]|nr:Oligopeptide-binding protein OppA [Chlamydiota bacterium]